MTDIHVAELVPVLQKAIGGVDLPGTEDIGHIQLADLGFDSLAVLELLDAIQQTWGVALPSEAVDGTTSVAAVASLINETAQQPKVG